MRRFESAECVRLRTPAGNAILAWRAETLSLRLLGLGFLPALRAGEALLIPRCRSVHTLGMRFPLDVAFLTWPPAPHSEVLVLRPAVRPHRFVLARHAGTGGVAALEAPSGSLRDLGVRPGERLSVDSGAHVSEPWARVNGPCSHKEEEMTHVREIPQT